MQFIQYTQKNRASALWTASRQEDSEIIKVKFTALRCCGTRRFHMAAKSSIWNLRVSFMLLTETARAFPSASISQASFGAALCCSNWCSLQSSLREYLGLKIAFRSSVPASEYPRSPPLGHCQYIWLCETCSAAFRRLQAWHGMFCSYIGIHGLNGTTDVHPDWP